MLGCSSADEETVEPAVSSAPGLVLAEVSFDPPTGTPGQAVQVIVRIPAAQEASVTATLDGGIELPLSAFSRDGGYLVATAPMTALTRTGDQLVSVTGTSDAGKVKGFGLFAASMLASCSATEVLEAGRCVARSEGHALTIDAVATIGNMAALSVDDARNMQHPRSVYRVGNAIVGCNTDHIGIVAHADFEQMAVLLDEENFDPLLDEEDEGDGFTPVTETLLSEAGLKHCEALVLDDSRTIAISSSRGTFGAEGGLAVWRIPNLDGPPPWAVPELLSTTFSEDGFEGIALRDGILYAARKPNRLTTWALESDGTLTPMADIEVPELISAWDVELAGDLLFLSDPGMHIEAETVTDGPGDTQHYGHGHTSGAGRVFVLDVTDPADPQSIGWAGVSGAAKGMAALPNGFLAVACGSAGVDIVEVSNPVDPVAVANVDTPGTANDVFFRDGYLMVADWDAVRLYDVAEPYTPRFIDATDIGLMAVLESQWEAEVLAEGDEFIMSSGTIAMAYVTITDELEWIATDLDRIITGQLRPGYRAPRINLHDKRRPVRVGPDADPTRSWALKFSNGSSETLWVRVKETENVSSPDGTVVVAPGERAVIEATLSGLTGPNPPDRVILESNDPETPVRETRALAVTDQYGVGDPAPIVHLTGVNWCDAEGCDLGKRCVDTSDEIYRGRPMFFAFFSSW